MAEAEAAVGVEGKQEAHAATQAPPVSEEPSSPQEAAPPSTSSENTEAVEFKIQYGKDSRDVKRPYESTVSELKSEIEKTLGIPVKMQKLMYKGTSMKDDLATLRQAGLKSGTKVLLIGSVPAAAPGAPPAAAGVAPANWDEPKSDEPLSKQQTHAKVIAKGKPEDALPGIKDKQVPLSDEMTAVPGLLNSQGSKVRLTFKTDLQQLWVGSATSTQKVPYTSITKIEATPIEGQEEYSIVALVLGTTTNSKLWVYYFPSQYVAGLKIRILGVQSLI